MVKKQKGLSKEEISAMKDYLNEINNNIKQGEKVVLEKIGKMPEPDKTMAKKVHYIITKAAPELVPRLWYGMPAYSKNEKLICFFQNSHKFKTRYSTLGFSDKAKLDDGSMWPTVYALTKLNPTEEKKIISLVKKAIK